MTFGKDLERLQNSENKTNASFEAREMTLDDTELKIDDIVVKPQVRRKKGLSPESIEELAASIEAQGLISPIIVRPIGRGKFELVAGERRLKAFVFLKRSSIPALVKQLTEEKATVVQLIENIQRESLSAVDTVRGVKYIQTTQDLTPAAIAKQLGKSRDFVSKCVNCTLNEEYDDFYDLVRDVRTLHLFSKVMDSNKDAASKQASIWVKAGQPILRAEMEAFITDLQIDGESTNPNRTLSQTGTGNAPHSNFNKSALKPKFNKNRFAFTEESLQLEVEIELEDGSKAKISLRELVK
ncbi:ParB/RepB/Spo0J family partition protein [Vibrio mediterranei]|uniref:ParB/RepB/Spo0J family partition protein n=1 Tax=Vibrio mediterranei TaxID=689 RepID=UPI004069445F